MFALDARGDHVSTYTAILEQKAHGWVVEKFRNLLNKRANC
jgi:hypothetical protein